MSPRRNIRLRLGALTIMAVIAFVVITLAGASFAVILSLILILMLTACSCWSAPGDKRWLLVCRRARSS